MKVAADSWEVLLNVPRDIGDLGLHQPADVAAAHFRRQLADEIGEEHAARVGPAAEQQFRKARAVHTGRPVLWSGFIMTATPAGAGLEPDTSEWPADPAEREQLAELAATPDSLLISLTVGVRELTLPELPLAPAAVLSRALKARFGEDAHVYLVSYGEVPGVAVVRPQEVEPDGQVIGVDVPADAPVGEHILAEVNLLFPDDGALVTVTAATVNYGAVNDAALLAGTIARSIRVRSAGAEVGTVDGPARDGGEVAAEIADPGAAPGHRGATSGNGATPNPVGVVLPTGQALPAGLTLLGRSPQRSQDLPADHTVTLPDTSISRTHLAVRVVDGTVTATDLHSTNGTLVRRRDGAVLALVPGRETELVAGDEVNLGAALLRVVEQ